MIVERGNWMFELTEEWSEWFSPRGFLNWVNFTLIQVYYEDERCMGTREVVLRLLGLGVRICYVYDHDAEKRMEVRSVVEQLRTEYPGEDK